MELAADRWSVFVGDTLRLRLLVRDSATGAALPEVEIDSRSVRWASSDAATATVTDGLIRGRRSSNRGVYVTAVVGRDTVGLGLLVTLPVRFVEWYPSKPVYAIEWAPAGSAVALAAGARARVWLYARDRLGTRVDPRHLRLRTLDPSVALAEGWFDYDPAADTALARVLQYWDAPLPQTVMSVGGATPGATRVLAEGPAEEGGDTAALSVTVYPTAYAGAPLGAASLAAGGGGDHSCALAASGAAYCWGENRSGQLGDPTGAYHLGPVAVPGDLRFSAIAVGDRLTCGLAVDGALHCWGRMLDEADGVFRVSPPRRLPGDVPFTSVATSDYGIVCALTAAGEVYCGSVFELLTGLRPVPTPVRFASLDVGSNFACGLTADGAAHCFGLGGSPYESLFGVTKPLAPDARFTSLAVAGPDYRGYLLCGSTTAGEVSCWTHTPSEGATVPGGDGLSAPVRLDGGRALNRLALAVAEDWMSPPARTLCGLDEAGAAYCGDVTNFAPGLAPLAAVGGDARFTALLAARRHVCGLTAAGEVRCWGSNDVSQLGDGTLTDRPAPDRPVRAP